MRPYLRRILLVRRLRPPNRFLTQLPRSRPQLPFLSQPTRHVRFLTTERKQWLKGEFRKAGKYTLVIQTTIILGLTMAFGIKQEWLEWKYPTPHEWSWVSRVKLRLVKLAEAQGEGDEDTPGHVDWATVGNGFRTLLERLEDPSGDGVGLENQDEGGILVEGIGKTGYDITKKSIPWQLAYYDVLMGAARAAEHLDGWVADRVQHLAFPVNMVVGPSNPNPRPVPPGKFSAPKEEDCEAAYEPPETYYMRILTTRGFTERQRLDAALGYAAWLDYKGTPEAAAHMYKWALDIAASSIPNPDAIFDSTGKINPDAGPVSSNVLSATTALAVHHARNSNLSVALPIFLSVLRARRRLPTENSVMRSIPDEETKNEIEGGIIGSIKSSAIALITLFTPPAYPPPPPDGTTPPPRDTECRCEEAALMTYIGEIFYSSTPSHSPTTSSRDEGLAWTREAVDIAETELRSSSTSYNPGFGTGIARIFDMVMHAFMGLSPNPTGTGRNTPGSGNSREGKDGEGRGEREMEARRVCQQCLETGLGNWAVMVGRLAREERERRREEEEMKAARTSKTGGWLGIGVGGSGGSADKVERQKEIRAQIQDVNTDADMFMRPMGRWEAEEQVVRERVRRAKDVLGSGVVVKGEAGVLIA